jgi:hypothetical protein
VKKSARIILGLFFIFCFITILACDIILIASGQKGDTSAVVFAGGFGGLGFAILKG